MVGANAHGGEFEHHVRDHGTGDAAGDLGRDVGRGVAPAQATEGASASDTTGLKCPPETGPNMRMIVNRPAAVAAAFSNSCRPVLPGDRFWAAIPEPTRRCEEGRTEQLGEQAACEGRLHARKRIALTDVSSIDIYASMPVDLELAPKQKRAAGERCCEPVVYPDIEREKALRMAEVAKALGDPIRLQLVDVLRRHAGEVCVCELVPLFDISQPTLSHHLGKLRAAGIVGLRAPRALGLLLRVPGALEEISAWLS